MKLNMKVRFRSKTFWLTVIPAILEALYCILGALGIAPKLDKSSVEAVVMALLGVLTVGGVVIDHTTEGIKDSERAMTYEKPNCDGENASSAGCIIRKLFGGNGKKG